MKINECIRLLKASDCYILRNGNRHDLWKSNKTGAVFAVPRHGAKEIPEGTLKGILKAAGLK